MREGGRLKVRFDNYTGCYATLIQPKYSIRDFHLDLGPKRQSQNLDHPTFLKCLDSLSSKVALMI